ncbi:MAG: YaiI/YqxD family protein [Alphaproteobacteria bacterium]|nr:YaiI/YqxD family protein [Alphaproteobacteria bacterium]
MTDKARLPVVFVDADACPVRSEVVRISGRAGLVATFVANGGLRPSRDPLVRNVVVPQGADAADDWIVENLTPGDIVVTADIPLAHRAVSRGAAVLGPTGRALTTDSIGMALAMRDLKQDLREAGAIAGYNPGFSQKDRLYFTNALANAVQAALKKGRG